MAYMISNLYVITAFLVIGGLLQGFDISSMSGIISTTPFKKYFGNPNANVTGGITASISGGSFLGCFVAFAFVDRIGRRDTMQYACVLFVVGAVIAAASVDVAMLIVGRLLCGGAVGIFTATGPTYLAELAPREIRGRILSLQQWSITWGGLIMYFITYGTIQTNTTASFRIPWAVQMVPAIVLFFALFFIPRSPRWLASQERWEECRNVLALLHGKGDPQAPLVQAEFAEIQESMEVNRAMGRVRWAELVRRENVQRVLTGVFVHIWAQLCGNNAILFYVSYIFQMAGLKGNIGLIAAGLQYAINVIFTLPAILFLDRIGRRPALLTGSVLMMVFLYATAGTMATSGHYVPGGLGGTTAVSWVLNDDANNAQRAVIACTYLLVATYSFTWAPISWVYPPEIYPQRLRGKAVSIATSANWIFGFANSYYTPTAFTNLQWRTFLIFGSFNIAAGIQAFFFFPETKGLTLEDVDDLFASGVKAWQPRPAKVDRLTELIENVATKKEQEVV